MALLDTISSGLGIATGIAGLFGGDDKKARNAAMDANRLNYSMNMDFAKKGIRWKVEDAIAAGLHPLAALGAQTSSPSAQMIAVPPEESKASKFARAGQNIQRAIHATRTPEERMATNLALKKAALENDLLSTQLAGAQRALMGQVGPPMPSAVSDNPNGDGLGYQVEKVPINATNRGRGFEQAGAHPEITYRRTTGNGLRPVMPQSTDGSSGDIFEPETLEWYVRNRISPVISGVSPPSTRDYPLPPGQRWKWFWPTQEFKPVGRDGKFHYKW